MPAGSVNRIKNLLAGSLKSTGKKEWPDGASRSTKLVPVRFHPSSIDTAEPPVVSVVRSTAGISKETPSCSAVVDVVATLDQCIVLDVPTEPFFWLPPVPR